jgi:AraC-like DNA-binding protein
MYDIRPPAHALQPYIECYWFLRARLPESHGLEEVVFTDARADLMFNFGDPYQRRVAGDTHSQVVRAPNLDGQRRRPVHISQAGAIDLVGVRFRPGGLAAFLPLPIHELADQVLDIRAMFGGAGDELAERLFEAVMPQRQRPLLDHFFLARLQLRPEQRAVAALADRIERQHGRAPIAELSASYGYSIRTMDRMFQQTIGLSPKFYSRLVRFQGLLGSLVHQLDIRWADTIDAHGYYDQAHLIHEFRSFTGMRPEQYRAYLRQRAGTPAPNHVQFIQDRDEHTY